MYTKLKLQLSAAAVIANGVLALVALAPESAIASSCSSHNTIKCSCAANVCPQVPGCTLAPICLNSTCEGLIRQTLCAYQ